MRINITKTIKRILITVLLVTASPPAYAWHMELSNSDGTLEAGEYYSLEIRFHGDPDENLHNSFLSVAYNEEWVEFIDIAFESYDDGVQPFPTTTWQGGVLPFNASDIGVILSIMGTEPSGSEIPFYPAATGQTLLATLWFTAHVSGDYEDIVVFTLNAPYDGVTVDDIVWEYDIRDTSLSVSKNGTTSILSPVRVNQPPVLSSITTLVYTDADRQTRPIRVTASDLSYDRLQVTAQSSDRSVFPNDGIAFQCNDDTDTAGVSCHVNQRPGASDELVIEFDPDTFTGSTPEYEFTFTAAPTPNIAGAGSDITISVSDGNSSATLSIPVTIAAPEPPTITWIENVSVVAGQAYPIELNTQTNHVGSLFVSIQSSNPAILPHENIRLSTRSGGAMESATMEYVISEDSTSEHSEVLERSVLKSQSNRFTVMVTPVEETSGTVTLTAVAGTGYSKSTAQLEFEVLANGDVPDPPTPQPDEPDQPAPQPGDDESDTPTEAENPPASSGAKKKSSSDGCFIGVVSM